MVRRTSQRRLYVVQSCFNIFNGTMILSSLFEFERVAHTSSAREHSFAHTQKHIRNYKIASTLVLVGNLNRLVDQRYSVRWRNWINKNLFCFFFSPLIFFSQTVKRVGVNRYFTVWIVFSSSVISVGYGNVNWSTELKFLLNGKLIDLKKERLGARDRDEEKKIRRKIALCVCKIAMCF